ncbi:MAG: ABC transporter permease [Halanaerobiaceae bacterium]
MRKTDKDKSDEFKTLSRWKLSLRKFKRNRLAIIGLIIVLFMYLITVFAGFWSPYTLREPHDEYNLAPPQKINFFDEDGDFHFRPFVYDYEVELDMTTMERKYTENLDKKYPVYFFVKGSEYKILNLIPSNIHFFGVEEPGKIFLFGTDDNSRDLFSRVLYGGRVSLSVGLIGVALTIILGSLFGVISGYHGGTIDIIIQRIIEVLLSFPRIPLWMALAAAVPATWSSIKVYFGITVILSLVNWGGLARQLRGKVLSLSEEEYIDAARSVGAGQFHIIFRHLIPNVLSHIIVIATLSIPGMILGETMLSFLGLGIRPPMTSWGVLLEQAQRVRVIVKSPWITIPAFFVIVTVLGFNFLGDGIRDAADPFTD